MPVSNVSHNKANEAFSYNFDKTHQNKTGGRPAPQVNNFYENASNIANNLLKKVVSNFNFYTLQYQAQYQQFNQFMQALNQQVEQNKHQPHSPPKAQNKPHRHPPEAGQPRAHTVNNESTLKNPEAKKYLATLLAQSNINFAGGTKDINVAISAVSNQLKINNASPEYFNELKNVKAQLIKETQQTHTESVILKLLKKAGENRSTTEAFDLVKKSPAIHHEKKALEAFDRISKNLINRPKLSHINISAQLNSLKKAKPKPTSNLVNMDKIREQAIAFASIQDRMDKENTGLKHTIITDIEGNLIALKNSIKHNNEPEDQELKSKLLPTLNKNYNHEKNEAFTRDRTHMHRKKSEYIKAILGKGAYSKVRPGQNILTGKYIAIKKMKDIERAKQEYIQNKKLIEKLGNNSADMAHFLTIRSVAITNGKRGDIKVYITSPLQEGDGWNSLGELYETKYSQGQDAFEKKHGKFILKTMETLTALERNKMVHGDLKWGNIIGGKIADLDGICYKKGDLIEAASAAYLPPDIKREKRENTVGCTHPSQESYDKHTSFTFGRMLLESIDPAALVTFQLPEETHPIKYRPTCGYSKDTPIPTCDSKNKAFTHYEKDIIRLAYSLAATDPKERPTIEEARKEMAAIHAAHS